MCNLFYMNSSYDLRDLLCEGTGWLSASYSGLGCCYHEVHQNLCFVGKTSLGFWSSVSLHLDGLFTQFFNS
jgi:hypothetical protein